MDVEAEFSGKRLLIIEDGYFLDDETKSLLTGMGVVAICVTENSVIGAREIDGNPDGAIVDINFPADTSLTLSETLEEFGIPHVFAIGRPAPRLKTQYSAFYLCPDQAELRAILAALFGADQFH
jgi:hypothetical protein